jgi:hypothetical protein
MEFDLQNLFGLLCTLAMTPQLPPPPQFGSYTRALLVSQDRRHLFVTPWRYLKIVLRRSTGRGLRAAIAVLLAEQPAHKTKTMKLKFLETQSINPNKVQTLSFWSFHCNLDVLVRSQTRIIKRETCALPLLSCWLSSLPQNQDHVL